MTSLQLKARQVYLEKLDREFAARVKMQETAIGSFEGWFLGPKAENEELLTQLILEAIRKHCEHRRGYRPEDPTYITADTKQSKGYLEAVKRLKDEAGKLFSDLQQNSVPIASLRSQGHMLWDQVLPATIGYFGAMLYNQNNVAVEASPYTTRLEILVGKDLCRMLGYPVPGEGKEVASNQIRPWAHITGGGSVANIEALWAARNVKFLALALREALRSKEEMKNAKKLKVRLLDGREAPLIDLDDWRVLNLQIDDVVSLPLKISEDKEINIPLEVTTAAVADFAIQNIGLIEFYRKMFLSGCEAPVAFAPATAHYSWPKAATLLGLGKSNLRGIEVDFQARMRMDSLRTELQKCLDARTPVIAVVAVVGSTEENAVDPLCEILNLREEFRKVGLDFAIHADAAWGGYFASLLRTDPKKAKAMPEIPTYELSDYVRQQIQALPDADSITVDPHKAGYVSYPAGALCYRNSAMRDVVSLKSPVVFHSQSEPTVGIYGVEGSKPGAAAAAVYLTHQVIRPTREGYGKILRQCIFTSKRMYCRLATMPDSRVKLVCLQMTPAERGNKDDSAIEAERRYIRQNFVLRSNSELEAFLKGSQEAAQLFAELGSDGVILTFSFNFYDAKSGLLNECLGKLNQLNQEIFEMCSMTQVLKSLPELSSLPLILTSSSFSAATYGQAFVNHFCRRLGVRPEENAEINFLISTTMDPWITETSQGDFLEVVEQTLRDVAHRALDELIQENWKEQEENEPAFS
jgi:glutamate/tyrosine decarboxylase-like PLP-dependent enzyme